MDCDLGLANLDVLLGIAPEGNLQQVIMDERAASDIIYPISEKGRGYFDILPAASGVPELAEMDADMRDLLLRRLEPELRKYSAVLLDLGAGINGTVRLLRRHGRRASAGDDARTYFADRFLFSGKGSQRSAGYPGFSRRGQRCGEQGRGDGDIRASFSACGRFLGFTPVLLGSVRHDPAMSRAVCRQQPLLKVEPEAPAAKDILRLSGELLKIRGVHGGRLKWESCAQEPCARRKLRLNIFRAVFY